MKCRSALLLASLLLFTSCQKEQSTELSTVRAAQSGLRVGAAFSGGEMHPPIPAALAGVQAGVIFSEEEKEQEIPSPLKEATVGRGEALQDIELLERFVTILKVDVRDLLNQSRNREAGLKKYITSLESHTVKAESRLRSLQDREEELGSDEKRLKGNVRDVQNDLETAIRSGETTSTSALMDDVLKQQTRLAQVSTELSVIKLLVNAFDDVVQPLQERLAAVKANEDALIKGVAVTDLPGVEDLGIIRVEEGVRRLRSRSRNGSFGGQIF